MKKYLPLLLLVFAGCTKSSNPTTTINVPTPVLLVSANSNLGVFTYKHNGEDKLSEITNTQNTAIVIPLTYDANGWLTSYGQPGRGQTYLQFKYDAVGKLTSFSAQVYDMNSQLQKNYNVVCTLDAYVGLVVQMVVYDASQPANAAPLMTYQMSYDSNKNLIKRVTLNPDGSTAETDDYFFGTNYSPQFTNHLLNNVSPFIDEDFFNSNERIVENITRPNAASVTNSYSYQYKGRYPSTESILTTGGNSSGYLYNFVGL